MRVQGALQHGVTRGRVFYAMKSNRHVPLLMALRATGQCGLDVCSPRELLLARECGFAEEEITYTGTAMSPADLAVIARFPGIALNCDSLAALDLVARYMPGRRIGLRLDPAVGIGYRRNARLDYAGVGVSKFGILLADLPVAVARARDAGLVIEGLHVHAGCGFLTPQLASWDRILSRMKEAIERVGPVRYVNLGGGLGIPLVARDHTLDLAAWTKILRKHFGNAAHEVWIEPGDYIAKDAGVLLLDVTAVETKAEQVFVRVNGGFNLHPEPLFYGLPLEPVPVLAGGRRRRVTIAGNINEAHDLWAHDVLMSLPQVGDVLALLNAGGYGASMASSHCLRGEFQQHLLWS
jgi:diaminopimelate decarboxylase